MLNEAVPVEENEIKEDEVTAGKNEILTKDVSEEYSEVYVHVCGAVINPGVYKLNKGERVYDAVMAAGGISDNGCGYLINQARQVEDGERIYVPSENEADMFEETTDFSTDGGSSDTGLININTCTKEDLMTLSGIGESKAESIISYRKANGNFKSIEDIKNVDGIKDGVFNKIKDKIKVGFCTNQNQCNS